MGRSACRCQRFSFVQDPDRRCGGLNLASSRNRWLAEMRVEGWVPEYRWEPEPVVVNNRAVWPMVLIDAESHERGSFSSAPFRCRSSSGPAGSLAWSVPHPVVGGRPSSTRRIGQSF